VYGILSAGRPLVFIGDPDGEIARVIKGANCGRIVRVGDSRGLTDLLRELASDPEGRTSMGVRARDLLCERFNLQRASERWLALLDGSDRQSRKFGEADGPH